MFIPSQFVQIWINCSKKAIEYVCILTGVGGGEGRGSTSVVKKLLASWYQLLKVVHHCKSGYTFLSDWKWKMAAVDIKTNLVSVTNIMSSRFSAGRIDWPFDICRLISSCFSIGTGVQSGWPISIWLTSRDNGNHKSCRSVSHVSCLQFINFEVDTFYPMLSLGRSKSWSAPLGVKMSQSHSPRLAAPECRESPRRTSSDKFAAHCLSDGGGERGRARTTRSDTPGPCRATEKLRDGHRLIGKVDTSATYNLISLSVWNVDDWGVISILWIDKIYQSRGALYSHSILRIRLVSDGWSRVEKLHSHLNIMSWPALPRPAGEHRLEIY